MYETTGSQIPYPPKRGSFTLPANTSTLQVSHALGVAPDTVIPIPRDVYAAGAGLIITAKAATTFDIEAVNQQGVDAVFDYEVGKD